MRPFNYVWMGVLCVVSNAAFTLQSDHDQPMIANSDTAQMFQTTHTGIYRGHVVVDQGSTELTADQVTIKLDAHNQVDSAIALGNPAHCSTLPHPNGAPAKSYANRIEYYPKESQVILIGDAAVMQDQDSYNAETIYYNTATQEVRTPKQAKQLTIVIKPKPKAASPSSSQPVQNNPS